MKPAPGIARCADLGEVRSNIDRIDREIVALLVERGAYVVQAARFKRNAEEVRAPDRARRVIENAARMASAMGGDGPTVERIYGEIVAAFTDAELAAKDR